MIAIDVVQSDFFAGLKQWLVLSGNPGHRAWLIYGGDREHQSDNVGIIPWSRLPAQKIEFVPWVQYDYLATRRNKVLTKQQ